MLLLFYPFGLIFGSVHLDGSHSQPIQITESCFAAQLVPRADLGSGGLMNTPMQAASHLSPKRNGFLGLRDGALAPRASGEGDYI